MRTARMNPHLSRLLMAAAVIVIALRNPTDARATPGLVVPVADVRVDASSGQCTYVLSERCLVRVRAGVPLGPLIATIADWVIQEAGTHTIPLDATLQNGDAGLLDLAEIVVSVLTCALPESFQPGRDAEGASFERLAAMSRQPARGSLPPERAAGMSPFWRAGLSREPAFDVAFPEAARRLDGALLLPPQPKIRLSTSDRVRAELRRPTGELTTYVDFKLLSEEDAPGSSEEKTLDLSACSPGEHILTLNLRDPGGNVGARSYRFEVRPTDELERMRPPDDSKPQP